VKWFYSHFTSCETDSGDVGDDGADGGVFADEGKMDFYRILQPLRALRELRIVSRNGYSLYNSYAQSTLLSGVDTTIYAKWDKVCSL